MPAELLPLSARVALAPLPPVVEVEEDRYGVLRGPQPSPRPLPRWETRTVAVVLFILNVLQVALALAKFTVDMMGYQRTLQVLTLCLDLDTAL